MSAGVRRTWADPEVVKARMRRYAAAVDGALYPSLAVALAARAPGFGGVSKARLSLLAVSDRRGVVAGVEVRLIEVDHEGWPIEPDDAQRPTARVLPAQIGAAM